MILSDQEGPDQTAPMRRLVNAFYLETHVDRETS